MKYPAEVNHRLLFLESLLPLLAGLCNENFGHDAQLARRRS
jgi:hypothetical protein